MTDAIVPTRPPAALLLLVVVCAGSIVQQPGVDSLVPGWEAGSFNPRRLLCFAPPGAAFVAPAPALTLRPCAGCGRAVRGRAAGPTQALAATRGAGSERAEGAAAAGRTAAKRAAARGRGGRGGSTEPKNNSTEPQLAAPGTAAKGKSKGLATKADATVDATQQADATQHDVLLEEFALKALMLLREAGGGMESTKFQRRWKYTFPSDDIKRYMRGRRLSVRSSCPHLFTGLSSVCPVKSRGRRRFSGS